jgi:hypothetical protein
MPAFLSAREHNGLPIERIRLFNTIDYNSIICPKVHTKSVRSIPQIRVEQARHGIYLKLEEILARLPAQRAIAEGTKYTGSFDVHCRAPNDGYHRVFVALNWLNQRRASIAHFSPEIVKCSDVASVQFSF